MKYLFLILIAIASFEVLAQPETAPTDIIGGKKYYMHTVEQGNTLFGLQKTYGVSTESIIKSNPGVEKGLSIGQVVKIEIPLVRVAHKVQKSETLFGLARLYNVSMDTIKKYNPKVSEGLTVGETLDIRGVEPKLAKGKEFVNQDIQTVTVDRVGVDRVDVEKPKVNPVSFSDSIIDHTVLDNETLYSISKRFMVPVEELQKLNGLRSSKINPGDIIKIPVKKESVEQIKVREIPVKEIRKVDSTLLFPKRDTYKVAILLPFNLDKGSNDQLSVLATDFYMGVKLALDSLEKLGLKAEVFVHDVKSDSVSLKKILLKPEFKSMDLVIGPLLSDNTDIVSRWCMNNNIRQVCPVSANPAVLQGNPFVYQAVPTDVTLMQGLAQFVLSEHATDQIVLVRSGLEKDKLNYDAFRSAFMTLPVKGTRPKLVEATMDNYGTFLKKGINSAYIFPTVDRSAANKFHNGINVASAKMSSNSLYVYGTKDWLNFDDLPLFKGNYAFGYPSPNDFNYDDDKTKNLHRQFRSEFAIDMSKIAVQGFDVIYYFCAELLLNKNVSTGIMNEFEMVQAGSGNGYENMTTFILRQENGEFVRVK
jgi:LysM repeat protein